jgi:hypothetical protein
LLVCFIGVAGRGTSVYGFCCNSLVVGWLFLSFFLSFVAHFIASFLHLFHPLDSRRLIVGCFLFGLLRWRRQRRFFVGFLQLRRDGDNLVVGSGDFSSSFSGGGGDSDILVVSCCSLAVARQFGCWSWRFFLAAAGATVLLLVVGCFFLRLQRDGEIIWLLLDLVFPPSLVATVVAAARRRDGLIV